MSNPWVLGLGGVVVLVIIAALLWSFRGSIFGGGLNLTGSARTRQPRLGIVDAFDLDRQRQLVLIRRDNIEHLVMIGGPNDLLIEQAIVRAQPSTAVPVREKDSAPAMPLAPSLGPIATGPTAASAPAPAAIIPPTIIVPDVAPVQPQPGPARTEPALRTPGPDAPKTSAPPTTANAPGQPPAEPRAPVPQRGAPPPRQPGSGPQPARPGLVPRPTTPGTGSPTPRALPAGPRPSPLSRVTSAASTRREPGSDVTLPVDQTPKPADTPAPDAVPTPAPAPPVVNEAAVEPPAPLVSTPPVNPAPEPEAQAAAPVVPPPETKPLAPTIPATLDTLESLEEEMAKLLGRSVGDKG